MWIFYLRMIYTFIEKLWPLTCDNIDIEGASSTVARPISECVSNLCGANVEESAWSMSPWGQCHYARVVGGSWLGPGDNCSRTTRCCRCGDIVDAGNDRWRAVNCKKNRPLVNPWKFKHATLPMEESGASNKIGNQCGTLNLFLGHKNYYKIEKNLTENPNECTCTYVEWGNLLWKSSGNDPPSWATSLSVSDQAQG